MTIDESLISYQPKPKVKLLAEQSGEGIPVVYIPRKPHPNGLLLYLSCSWISHPIYDSKLPFIIDLIPYLKFNDINPTKVVEIVIER